MIRTEDNKNVESEDNKGEKERGGARSSHRPLKRHKDTTSNKDKHYGKPGKQMEPEYSFNIIQNKMEQ